MPNDTGCHAGRSNISVDDNGDVYPCHLFHYDKFKMGNIFTDSIPDIMQGEKNKIFVKEMHVDHNNEFCRSCAVRYLCGGGCKVSSGMTTAGYSEPWLLWMVAA